MKANLGRARPAGELRRGPRLTTAQRRNSIVMAAMHCFAERGFAGTTTRMLARAAGVSEALVFRHFPTKRSLYKAIIERKISEPADGLFPVSENGRSDDRAVLASIADTMVRRVEADPTFMRLLLYSSLEGAPLAPMFFKSRVRAVRSYLGAYLEHRMKEGAMRRADPETAATAFLGMIIHHLQCKLLFHVPLPRLRRRDLVDFWVDLFLKGMRP